MDHDKSFLTNSILESIFKVFDSSRSVDKILCAKILLKFLESSKRLFVIGKYLEDSVTVAIFCTNDSDSKNILVGIKMFQFLFDTDEDISEIVFKLSGLQTIVKHCKTENFDVLEACAIAIFKAVLNGGKNCENYLVRGESLSKWLLPMLNIYVTRPTKFYAYLSVNYLRTVCKKNNELLRNGFLDDIILWISDAETYNALLNSFKMISVDRKKLIRQILPMLIGSCKVSHTLGSFLICCEIFKCSHEFNNDIQLFSSSEKLEKSLQRIVLLSIDIAKKFASCALSKIHKDTPYVINSDVKEWSKGEREEWFRVIGFSDYLENFFIVEAKDLCGLNIHDLKNEYFMFDCVKRKEFFEEIEILMHMTSWSQHGNKLFKPFKSNFKITQSETKPATEAIKVQAEPSLSNGTNLSLPGSANSTLSSKVSSSDFESVDSIATIVPMPGLARLKKKTDVFISYRRNNGADLASLLKFQLTLKGFKVFFDVESLRAGLFGQSLIKNVQEARNFILILTPNSLDRCVEDVDNKDWVKKEILTAFASDCNMIPVVRDFDFKVFEDERCPPEIKALANFNQVLWHHDGQNGCFNKIVE